MADLLLELFSEEIPARMQKDAAQDLVGRLALGLQWAGFHFDEINGSIFVTPRRLAVRLRELPSVFPDINTELKGPRVDAPQQAIDGFLKKSGMKLEQLEKRDGTYVARIHQKGRPTAEVLKEIIEKILAEFPWPKSMRWGDGEQTWVRPLHSILCIFDGKVVPVEFAGIKASNITYGHRFLAPKAITINKPEDYEPALEKAFVIADHETRKKKILEDAQAAVTKAGLKLREDDGLLEEVTGLVEWPVVLIGTIDKNFMDLPEEVLVSEMRSHQKYFATRTDTAGFTDKFLITANMKEADKTIVAGNERVLRARLADGQFFWDQDRKRKLDEMAKGLAAVTYHAKLGSVADKVGRVGKLAAILADTVKANKKEVERAAALCKADLVSGMVGEFPELQGVMGRYYAMHQKEPQDVADAIRDHYLPLGPSSPIPVAPVSICVALADKLDTLIAMFAIGEKPTGSKDPFALRRAALGVIRIILEKNLRLPLISIVTTHLPLVFADITKQFAEKSAEKFGKIIGQELLKHTEMQVIQAISPTILNEQSVSVQRVTEILNFFHDRLIVQLKDSGIRHDVIKAVIANGDDDLVRIVKRAEAVQAFLDSEDGKNLLAGYKRAANIVAIEEKKDKMKYADDGIRNSDFKEPEEKTLINAIIPARESMRTSMERENFVEAMRQLASIRPSVDAFFDKIMVNCEDKALRIKRLKLLSSIRDYMNMVADFSKIEGEAREQRKAA